MPLQVQGGHADFLLPVRISDGKPHHEPIHLGLRQGIGPQELHRVLGGYHQEWPGQGMHLPVHGDLPLRHGLQEAGLGLWGSAVDFVRQQNLVHHRPGPILELACLLIVDGHPRHIPGQGIRGELDPAEAASDAFGQHARQGGLAHPGNVLQQHMSPGEEAYQELFHHVLLADEQAVDIVLQVFCKF